MNHGSPEGHREIVIMSTAMQGGVTHGMQSDGETHTPGRLCSIHKHGRCIDLQATCMKQQLSCPARDLCGHGNSSVPGSTSTRIRKSSPWLCWVQLYSLHSIRALSKFPLQQAQHVWVKPLYGSSSTLLTHGIDLQKELEDVHCRNWGLVWRAQKQDALAPHLDLLLQQQDT